MFREEAAKILKEALALEESPDFSIPPKKDMGHLSTPLPLRLAKKDKKNPLEIASSMASSLIAVDGGKTLDKAEGCAPGFLNLWFTPEFHAKVLEEIAQEGTRYPVASRIGSSAIIEYLSPNIAKPLHVGHLRNLILGDALANIYESAGWDVTRWNYIGDWGTQFGKLIFAYRRWGDKEQVEKNPISELTSLYVRFHQEAEYDKTLEEGARLEFKKLETGDEENRTMWQWFKELSLKDMQDLLNRVMASPFDVEQGEAFYENDLGGVIAEVVSAGITKESEGALVIPLPDKELPAMIRKSDGASLYLTRDIANLKYRLKEFTPAEILYVIGNEQSLQFEQFFTVAGMLGLDKGAQLFHIKYGLVLSADGKKFSTRKGDTVLASDILDEAEIRALKVVMEKRGDLEDFQQKEIAKDIALSAVKYAMLKDGRTTDISFDWDRMLDFHGDSGPYLLYTHARLRTMLSKSEDRCLESIPGGLLSEEELALIRQIAEFPSVIEAARSEKSVNKICLYLYGLCNGANAWYEGAPVIKDEDKVRRAARLTLGEAIADTLSRGLRILSIPTPERI